MLSNTFPPAGKHSPALTGSIPSYPDRRFRSCTAKGISRNIQCLWHCLLSSTRRHSCPGSQAPWLRGYAVRLLERGCDHVHHACVRILHSNILTVSDLANKSCSGAHPFDYEPVPGETNLYSYCKPSEPDEIDSQYSQESYRADQLVKKRIVHGEVEFPSHVWDNLIEGMRHCV